MKNNNTNQERSGDASEGATSYNGNKTASTQQLEPEEPIIRGKKAQKTEAVNTPESVPELLTVKETAEYLRIPMATVYYLLGRGQLPGVQIGGRWRVKRSLLDSKILATPQEQPDLPATFVVAALDESAEKIAHGMDVEDSFVFAAGLRQYAKLGQPHNVLIVDHDHPECEAIIHAGLQRDGVRIVVMTGGSIREDSLAKYLGAGPLTIARAGTAFADLRRHFGLK